MTDPKVTTWFLFACCVAGFIGLVVKEWDRANGDQVKQHGVVRGAIFVGLILLIIAGGIAWFD